MNKGATVVVPVDVTQLPPDVFAAELRSIARHEMRPSLDIRYRNMVTHASDAQLRAYARIVTRKKPGGLAHRAYSELITERTSFQIKAGLLANGDVRKEFA